MLFETRLIRAHAPLNGDVKVSDTAERKVKELLKQVFAEIILDGLRSGYVLQ